MEHFIQLLIFGVQLGVIYALIAMGYTMVYGIIRLINFAHGDLVMIGAFTAYFVARIPGFGFIPVMVAAMIVPAVISVVIERLAYRPLRNRPRLSVLITAIGVSIFLENLPRMIPVIGPNYRPFPQLIAFREFRLYGSAVVNTIQITNIAASLILLTLLIGIVRFTKTGRAMRAVSFNKEAAALMGIDVNRVIALTFFVGAALAGAGGVLYSLTYPMIDVLMGVWLGTKAFVAAVLGGIGSIPGAVLGGLLMGIVEVFATAFNSELGYGAGFIILILVLLFRPEGLMGRPTIEKV
ncbi:MAG: branched-chain amino acid ABC transporter permease [Synergistaceae bacterium]|jgi:branched-chain amino acid transport system permease protein|nr:branched-chain amino acid ABC transporter permease [Synergistaceae bacterium]